MRQPKSLLALLIAVVICVWIGSAVRMGKDMRQPRMDGLFDASAADSASDSTTASASTDNWFSVDPDGLYHSRRVERIFNEGYPVAGEDPLINAPFGAPIPWPPYYEVLCHQILSPFAPDDAVERAKFLEQWMAMLPFVFGLITISLLVWVSGHATISDVGRVGSNQAFRAPARGLLAGLMLAFSYGAAHYSPPGLSDHHAWVGLLTLLMFILISAGMRDGVLDRVGRSGMYGLTAGAVGGVLLGTWVASLLFILMVQLAFGVMLLRQRSQPRAGLAAMGISFHVAAFATVMPAAMGSPWSADYPWMVVNLSWFHLVHLALGGFVFLPLRRIADGKRMHPLALPIGIVAALLIVTAIGVGPGAGIREGMAWVSRADEFMSGIAESEPLLNADLFTWVGFGVLLLPFAWFTMLRHAWQKRQAQHWIWVVAIPLLLLQALSQRRFSDVLAAPMAWVIAWAVFEWLKPWFPAQSTSHKGMPAKISAWAIAIIAGFGLNAATLPSMTSPFGGELESDPIHNANREVYEWIGAQPLLDAEESVLATWDQGHAIEWLTKRGSVATNFGSYVGEDSFRDPPRFFLSNDRVAAEEILKKRKTRYVVRTSQLPLSMDALVRALQSDEVFVESITNKRGQQRDRLTARWYQSMAAILWMPVPPRDPQNPVLGTGLGDPDGPTRPMPPIEYLRLVHLSPVPDSDPRHGGMTYPAAAVWEYVPGARLSAKLDVGQTLVIDMKFTLTFQEQSLISFQYQSRAAANADGTAEIRVPYSTQADGNGGSLYVHEAQFRIEAADGNTVRGGALNIAESDILQGKNVSL